MHALDLTLSSSLSSRNEKKKIPNSSPHIKRRSRKTGKAFSQSGCAEVRKKGAFDPRLSKERVRFNANAILEHYLPSIYYGLSSPKPMAQWSNMSLRVIVMKMTVLAMFEEFCSQFRNPSQN